VCPCGFIFRFDIAKVYHCGAVGHVFDSP